ncbi:SCO family protein [Nitrosomonas supralitoralis]|uniref:SCO family protein n=1 Tax=Nitrosomonas supralitoralis TaxID=2116706 RepID=A0A2P7NSZ3_9PROT|nr:SCO family protein [Nitrosomonas supralitoralis]PSJ16586.1 SCO family protein [Nitrosomonas supralitoralis]
MNKDIEPVNSRREILAGMGLAVLGLVGLNSAWKKLGFEERKSTVNPNISKYRPTDSDTQFPNVTLYTHDGEAVKFYDDLIRDKVVAINMMYSQCSGICPKSTANLLQVRKLLGERAGRDVFMYSITLDPVRDTPKMLRQYAERYGIEDGWKFLTGATEDIELVRYRLGFYDPEEDLDNIKENHTGMVRIGNDERNRWSMAPTLSDPEQIMSTINHLDPKAVHTAVHTLQSMYA